MSTDLSTGLPGLDRALKGLAPGDNIVWQVDAIGDYLPFVEPYCREAVARGRTLVYFRFAGHEPLVPEGVATRVYHLHPDQGFETFLAEVHGAIESAGRGAFYVFDCLSELAADWYSDRMLGNFFRLTCPYLFDLETITYFVLLRGHHSTEALTPITQTTQLFLNVHRHEGKLYVHPMKVVQRYSPTMFLLHAWEDDEFRPVPHSATIAEILAGVPSDGLDAEGSPAGVWDRTFRQAEQLVAGRDEAPPEERQRVFGRLLRMVVSRHERVLGLARHHLTLEDLIAIRKRMIGTGLIGGKSVGMLLARAILRQADPRWQELLEPHDSFFVGSDVFYTFLVQNGVWWMRQKQRDPDSFLEGAEAARRRLLTADFPGPIVRQFAAMLNYFGQCPLIVRSSSLLEDNFGNAFAGKYESFFCPNQGPHEKRLDDFLTAVRTIYASTMSEKALSYRAARGLLDRDEQMALLVQRVSGTMYGDLFYPQASGVGFSYNPYVWSDAIDPEAGVLRLVLGLGTRAVDRSDDDYTRLVALNAPDRRPEGQTEDLRRHSQRRVDFLDLEANRHASSGFADVVERSPGLPLEWFASRDADLERRAATHGAGDVFPWILTFDRLLSETQFVGEMRQMLQTLHRAYNYPVDVEFTCNFLDADRFRVNLVQCRPLQVKGGGPTAALPERVEPERLVLETHGPVIGTSVAGSIDRIVYVVPSVYGQMPIGERHSVARVIGQLDRLSEPRRPATVMLLGPGRWGTTTPSLGVPVRFADISHVSVLGEIVAMRKDLVPDVSLGTHFFSELVEMDILYLAVFPDREGNLLNTAMLEAAPNHLAELLPDAEAWARAVRVIDPADLGDHAPLRLCADVLKQRAVCYLDSSRG